MIGSNRKWSALFVLLIALPATFLTYFSARSFQDEQRAAIAAIDLLVPDLHQQLDWLLDDLSSAALKLPGASTSNADFQTAGIEFVFRLDSSGQLRYPTFLPLSLAERSTFFSAAMLKGEEIEFQERDLREAASAYEEALGLAQHPREKAESLNAIGRARVSLGQLASARAAHEQLEAEAISVVDADGGHPLSMSYVRLAERLPADEALPLLEQWVRRILAGQYPVFSGVHLYLEKAEQRARSLRLGSRRAGEIIEQIAHARRLADRTATFRNLVSSRVLTSRSQTVSGTDATGASFLLRTLAHSSGMIAVFYDLDELAAQLMQSPPGLELRSQGFGLDIFDADNRARFELSQGEATRHVASASRSIYRLNLGVYALNEAFVLRNYRNRNLFTLAGIFLLAGAIAGGVYLIFRDTGRQIQTAQLRSEFVANVSHELRTPLTAIRMYAETLLLERYHGRDQLREYLATIMQESQRLSRMVGNVLDFSRMESGRKAYDYTSADLGELVRDTAAEFRALLDQGSFHVAVEISPALPPIQADREAVATAVANLFSNAIKYSKERRELRVRVKSQNGFQSVEIADRGIGVPVDERTRIFGKFHRAANAGDTATGTGLGLALAKGVAEAHGGTLACRPREGGGTAFTLRLPQGKMES